MTNISKKERIERRKRKAEKIIFAIGITAVVFVVATYAWFIGTTEITVSTFELSVESGDGLLLSLDGEKWNRVIPISKEAIVPEEDTSEEYQAVFGDNTNSWVSEAGLVPLSSVGKMQTDGDLHSLELFSKSSIVSLNGGYRLRSDRLDNKTTEQDGYVAFDLYIKNQSGEGYEPDWDYTQDEGVYLTNTSSVKLKASGSDTQSDLERSIRLAFMQIGRVSKNADAELARSITCDDVEGDEDTAITGLCTKESEDFPESNGVPAGRGMTWNIWEPNDSTHTQNSIDHYALICKMRTAVDTYDTDQNCEELLEDAYKPTYAVNTNITADHNVNVYDGEELNGYTGSITTDGSVKYLTEMKYFTDTDKNAADKDEIFYLAPNSITKVRVYVYLEGQDVDNYDLGAAGKTVEITFGFTKDKFTVNPTEPEPEPEPEPGDDPELGGE